jgi:hypothetical protein
MSEPGVAKPRRQIPIPQRQPARRVQTRRCAGCKYHASVRRCQVCRQPYCDVCAPAHRHEEGQR